MKYSPWGSPKQQKSPVERAKEIAKWIQGSPETASARNMQSSVGSLLQWKDSQSSQDFSKSMPAWYSLDSPVKLQSQVTFPSYQKQENEKGQINSTEYQL